MTPEARFWAKVEKGDSCWIWTGAKTSPNAKSKGGYGMLRIDGRSVYAHRFSYELHIGPIPEGLHIDHICRTPACVNPDHMDAVTSGENMRRGMAPSAVAHRAGTCLNGHSREHAYLRKSTGNIAYCKACKRTRETA